MRHFEELPLDPEIAADLEIIDATLAGQIVDPIHADLAEITLFLAAERRRPPEDVGRRLDERLQARVAPRRAGRRGRRRILMRSAFGGAATAFAAAVAVVAVLSTGSPHKPSPVLATSGTAVHGANPVRRTSLGATSTATYGPSGAASHGAGSTASQKSATATNAPAASAPSTSALAVPHAPAPQTNGRRIVQSADLQLTAANNRVSDVAQEVFDVIGQLNGIVVSSSVTAAAGNQGYANISLSIPSGSLQEAMTRLSTLPYAHVAARTDATQDVNNQYLSDVRRLQDARALRTQLLKQLASAYTQSQIDSLNAQIHDAEGSISRDESALNGLKHRISFSSLTVDINAAPIVVPVVKPHASSNGFTLGRAARDSLRVLTVAAGVALIVLAALVPFGLLVALAAWIGYWVRRRRRDHALDAA